MITLISHFSKPTYAKIKNNHFRWLRWLGFDGVLDYDPQIQRFISEDPIGFALSDFNFYRYVGNSPVNFVDLRD